MGNILKCRDVESEVVQVEQSRMSMKELQKLLGVNDLIEMPKMKELPWVRILAPKKGYIDEYQGDVQRFIGYYISEDDKMVTMIDGCLVVGVEDEKGYTLLDEFLTFMIGTKLAVGMLDCIPPVIKELHEMKESVLKGDEIIN